MDEFSQLVAPRYANLVRWVAREVRGLMKPELKPKDGKEDYLRDALERAATEGLWVAYKTFDPARGVNFETFAKKVMRNHAIDYLRTEKRYEDKHVHMAFDKDSADDGEAVLGLDNTPASQVHRYCGNEPLAGMLKAEAEDSAAAMVDRLLAVLDPLEREIVRRHWGLDGDSRGQAIKAVAMQLGIKPDEAKAILARAMRKMRCEAEARGNRWPR
jgi:RNA polymerase sigma factor (sigma-70 family)